MTPALNDLLIFERELWSQGYHAVAGVDEAGRGPLAGPVVAAAVVFPPGQMHLDGVFDSKQLSKFKRERAVPIITRYAMAIGIGVVSEKIIDKKNILRATYQAMQEAIAELSIYPDFVLIDGRGTPPWDIPSQFVIKGDARSLSIAAASIIAKVERDQIMMDLHRLYPQYGFITNKGYPVKSHIEAMRRFGLSPSHRRSFKPKALLP